MTYIELSNHVCFADQSRCCPGFCMPVGETFGYRLFYFELYLNAKGHVCGALMLHHLRMHRIWTNTRKLKIVLTGWFQVIIHVAYTISYYAHNTCSNYIVMLFNVLDATSTEMYWKLPMWWSKDWRSQSIALARLEEVEINNLRGGDHDIDFVTSILGWAPMLTRMIIKFAHEVESKIGGCAMTIYETCLAYPSVDCSMYLSSDKKLSGPRAWLKFCGFCLLPGKKCSYQHECFSWEGYKLYTLFSCHT
jgi:hypothetical protein